MKVGLKMRIIILTAVLILIAGMYLASNKFIIGNIESMEYEDVHNSVKRMGTLIKRDIKSLSDLCLDWSAWDDTYFFMKNNDENFIEKNMTSSVFNDLNVQLLLIVNSSGNLVYGKMLNVGSGEEIDIPEEVLSHLSSGDLILNHRNVDSEISGLMLIKNTPFMITSRPITDTSKTYPANGTLIMGRILNEDNIKEIGELVDGQINMQAVDNYLPSVKGTKEAVSPLYDEDGISERNVDRNTVEGRVVVKDIYGSPILQVSLQTQRRIFNAGESSFKKFLIVILSLIIILVAAGANLIRRIILSRLARLNEFITRIGSERDTSVRINLQGNDEISNLAKVTNEMLDVIEKSNNIIRENEERLKLVLEGTKDGYWDLDLANERMYLSPKLSEMLGFGCRELDLELSKFVSYMGAMNTESLVKAYHDTIASEDGYFGKEETFKLPSGEQKWFLIRGKAVKEQQKRYQLRMAGTVSDITEQKRSQEAIRYLSFHDSLTGLYNRTYFNDRIHFLDNETYLPLSVIMGDANGLKLVNDAFGHKEGDNLLIRIGDILNKSSEKIDSVARIGGDEFVLLLPGVDEKEANSVCNRIKKLCDRSEEKPIRPSIALGVGTKKTIDEDIQCIIDIAEGRMYKNKLLEAKSTRHSIIASLERSLFETDHETKEHAQRLQDLALRLGKHLNLPGSQMDELALLSALHDIGKIAVPREVLNKPGALTREEWEIIKTHSDIGYRIALSSPELASIAEEILAHHEKWNGCGYPKGLSGKQIPLLSRIIAIVDAYDVITHSRPYKEALSHEHALEEIQRCSGSHFDPELVEVFLSMFNNTASDEAAADTI